MWHGLDGEPLDYMQGSALLNDIDARRIAQTIITTDRGQCSVSTVFLVLDHGWGDGRPVLWETMTFGGPADSEQRRYRSRTEALAGHHEAVSLCRSWCEIEGARIVAEETQHGRVNAEQGRTPLGTPPPVDKDTAP